MGRYPLEKTKFFPSQHSSVACSLSGTGSPRFPLPYLYATVSEEEARDCELESEQWGRGAWEEMERGK